MNASTIKAIENFAEAVELLAQGTLIVIGMEAATDVINKCEELKRAIKHEDSQANDT